MRKSGLTGDEAYALSKRRGTSGDLGPLKKELSLLKEDLGNLDSDLYSISSNILDTNGLLENTAIKDWGNPTIDNYTYESAGKYSTRPIPVLADEIYKSIGYEFCYILFNSDGSFTTGNSLLNSTVGTIKIPNGIGYIVFMFSNYSNIPTGIMRVESEQETPVYKPYGEKEKKYATVGDIEEVKEQIDNVTTTEPSKNVLLDGVLLENTDLKTLGTVTINNYNYASTGKYSTSLIDCKSGDVFYPVFSNGKGSPSMGYTIFDANGNMIDHDWTVSKSNCVVPVGGTKAAFMFNNKKYDGLMLYTSVNNIPVFETTDPKEKYAKVETTDHYPMYDYGGMEIKMVGKILCIGDSYTEGGFDRKEGDTTYYFSDTELSYPSNLERITGCNVTNKGDGGKTCETWWNAHANDDLSGHKICIIQIGINDTNKQEDGWNSISDVNLTNIVNKVRSENNGIPIFIATLPNEWAYGTSAYTVTNERIRSIANTLGLFVIDFEKENGFVFARDILGGHPTSFGTWEIAREWANAISAYLSDNKALFTKLQYVGTDYSY
jgi:lysophospholipase L1-like esterase